MKSGYFRRKYCWRESCRLIGCLAVLSVVQACAIANPKGAQYASEQTLAGSPGNPVDESLDRDGKIIRDTVIGASLSDQGALPEAGVAWVNEETGSRGVISQLRPASERGRDCHIFKTTREAFDGVMVYEGKTCRTPDGNWILSSFDAR